MQSKGNNKQNEKTAHRWEKIFANDVTDKKLVSKIYKQLMTLNGVITHLEPDSLECEVKWALGSITMNKARGGNGIPDELFQKMIL